MLDIVDELHHEIAEEHIDKEGEQGGEVKDIAINPRRREHALERMKKRCRCLVNPADKRRLHIGSKESEQKLETKEKLGQSDDNFDGEADGEEHREVQKIDLPLVSLQIAELSTTVGRDRGGQPGICSPLSIRQRQKVFQLCVSQVGVGVQFNQSFAFCS